MESKLPVSAVVVTFNEERHLAACLESLAFCDEIIVCDLGSTDRSRDIARSFGVTQLQRDRVPIVELLYEELFALCRNKWIIRFDPDQIMAREIADCISRTIAADGNVAIARLPMKNFFLGKALNFGYWGGLRFSERLYNRDLIRFTGRVHDGIRAVPGTESAKYDQVRAFPITHYWIDDYAQLIEKHTRYLTEEGRARYATGKRFTWFGLARACLGDLFRDLIRRKAFLDGWRGFFLVGFHIWYTYGCHMSLRRYQMSQSEN